MQAYTKPEEIKRYGCLKNVIETNKKEAKWMKSKAPLQDISKELGFAPEVQKLTCLHHVSITIPKISVL